MSWIAFGDAQNRVCKSRKSVSEPCVGMPSVRMDHVVYPFRDISTG